MFGRFFERGFSGMEVGRIRNVNVFLLGTGFMLVFAAFQTMGNIQTTILESAKSNSSSGFVPGFSGSGYVSLAVIYTVFAVANWLAPPAVALAGPRAAMTGASLTYAAFIAQFWYPNNFLLYLSSAILGFGAAVIWTAQGNFLTINSVPETMTRNSGIFWAMFQSSGLIGNTIVFFEFHGITQVNEATRNSIVAALFSAGLVGTMVLASLRPTLWVMESTAPNTAAISTTQAVRKAWALFWTPDMITLGLTFVYCGLELTFYSGVYGPSLGFTLRLGKDEAKALVGMHGIVLAIGEIVGGLLFGILGAKILTRFGASGGRDPVVVVGFLIHLVAYFLVFINLPNTAPFGDTFDYAYIDSSPALAMLSSFLLGFGDACFNTQIISILGSIYSDDSVSAFAIFKFVQSTSAAIAFFYSGTFGLYPQLLILAVSAVAGTYGFTKVELRSGQRVNQETDQERQSLISEQ